MYFLLFIWTVRGSNLCGDKKSSHLKTPEHRPWASRLASFSMGAGSPRDKGTGTWL